jgi:hypothetical protein
VPAYDAETAVPRLIEIIKDGGLFSRGHIYKIFSNPIYIGQIAP